MFPLFVLVAFGEGPRSLAHVPSLRGRVLEVRPDSPRIITCLKGPACEV